MPNHKASGQRSEARRFTVGLLCVVVLAACQVADSGTSGSPATYGLGTPATSADIAALNTDVSPSGEGLPPGSGDASSGAALYASRCAGCHGANGEGAPGAPPNPPLVGRDPREGFA